MPKEPKAFAFAPGPVPEFKPPVGFCPPHRPAMAFSLSRSFIDFPVPLFALENFVAPVPSDNDQRSSKLALATGVDFVCATGVVPGRVEADVNDALVGERGVAPLPKKFWGCRGVEYWGGWLDIEGVERCIGAPIPPIPPIPLMFKPPKADGCWTWPNPV